MEDMKRRPCPCGGTQEQVLNYIEVENDEVQSERVGWWCPKCNAFTKVIGREKVVKK